MTILNVKTYPVYIYDTPSNTMYGLIQYQAVEYYNQPTLQTIVQFGTVQNLVSTPYPTFVSSNTACAYYENVQSQALVDQINTQLGTTVYTSYDVELVDPSVNAALMSLTLDQVLDGVTYKRITSAEKTSIDSLATVATSGSYLDLTNKPSVFSGSYTDLTSKPTFATVAISGSYNDLTSKPTIFSGSYADLTGKPTLFSGSYTDLTGKPSLSTVATSGAYADLTAKPSLATVATTGSYTDLVGKPSFSTVATTGSYTDLANKPSIPAAQVQSDWNAVSGLGMILNKPSIPGNIPKSYNGTTQRTNPVEFTYTATITSGAGVIYLTSDGTSTGTALFINIDYIKAEVSDSTSNYNYAYALTNSNKTLTITASRSTPTGVIALLGISVLGSPTAAPNGTSISVFIKGN